MGWTKTMMTALFGDGGAFGYLRLSMDNPSLLDPLAPNDNSEEAVTIEVPEVTLRELRKGTRSFSDKTLIGEGRYSKVYMASLKNGMTVAAKMLGTPSADRWKASDTTFLMRQVSVASRLRHENLICLVGYNVTEDLRVLLYEYAALGTLHDALHGPSRAVAPAGAGHVSPVMTTLSWAQRLRIALDAARGLAYLHEAGVTHCDVRSTNVLLFPGFRAKIANYDLFQQLPPNDVESGYTFKYALHEYLPLEYITEGHMTQKGDVFSFGVVLLELLTGNKASDELKLVVYHGESIVIDPKLGKQYSRAGARKIAAIARRCLEHRPAARPSMATVAAKIQDAMAGG